jgi:NAD(P)-dependent dehydrogenase (short-subunit alcohol dehydrogenase family)
MSIDLRGKAIVITGASSGIGAACALECARAGMRVMLAARREDRLCALADRLRREGAEADLFALDVADEPRCRELIDRAWRRFGGVYAVFANAGYGVEAIPTHAMPDRAVRDMFEVNFFGSLNVIRPAVERLLASSWSAGSPPRGHMLMCSSCLAKMGTPGYAAYSASKAMQDHFCRAMRVELWDRGIRVSSVHPIGTRTEFFDRLADRGARLTARTPERFMQSAERVAREVVRCLRRPRGEVWTCSPARIALALSGLCPGWTDRVLLAAYRRRLRARAAMR